MSWLSSPFTFSGPGGQYATNVEANSSHDAVRKGLAFFLDPFWKGPKPKAGTILRLCPMGGEEIRVRVPPDPEKIVEELAPLFRRLAHYRVKPVKTTGYLKKKEQSPNAYFYRFSRHSGLAGPGDGAYHYTDGSSIRGYQLLVPNNAREGLGQVDKALVGRPFPGPKPPALRGLNVNHKRSSEHAFQATVVRAIIQRKSFGCTIDDRGGYSWQHHGVQNNLQSILTIRLLEERIRQRAYQLYIQRGDEAGSEIEDWLRAEDEIRNMAEQKGGALSGSARDPRGIS